MREKRKYGAVRRMLASGCSLFALTAVLVFGAALPVYAFDIQKEDGRSVYDYAGLFDEEQVRELEDEAARARNETDLDVVIVTTPDAEGKSAQEFADDAYDEGGFGQGNDYSGILYLIDMDNRELALSTCGEAIRIFTDRRIDAMLDEMTEAAQRDLGESAVVFLKEVRYYCGRGIQSDQYNYDTETGAVSVYRSIRWYEVLLAAVVSAVVAGGAVMTVKKQYRMEADTRQTANFNMAYRADSQFKYGNETDRLVGTFVTTSLIAAGAAAAAAGARRGSSMSGRSSTHHSGGGRTHGGGSRKF